MAKTWTQGKLLYCIDPQFLTAFLSLSKNGDKKKSHRKKWRWRRRRRRRKRQRPRHHIHDTRSTLRGWSPPALAHVGVDVWSGDWRVPRRWTQKQTTWGPTMKRIGCVASSCILYIYIYVFRIVPRSLPWDLKNGPRVATESTRGNCPRATSLLDASVIFFVR